MKHVIECTKKFLSRCNPEGYDFLLAFSGGPDSRALFEALCSLKAPFSAAHVDHGWRKESCDEAKALKQLCKERGVPFFLKSLGPEVEQSELAARQARYAYFKELNRAYGFVAVALGHHRGDRAETVLKRVLEAAHPARLYGMEEVSRHSGIALWRPLLSLSKEEVGVGVQGFDDASNRDPKYLRSRMRTSILPQLAETFGKQVEAPLAMLADESEKLKAYLDRRIAPLWGCVSEKGTRVEASLRDIDVDAYELRYFIKCLATQKSLTLSKKHVELIAQFLLAKRGLKRVEFGNGQVRCERGNLIILN